MLGSLDLWPGLVGHRHHPQTATANSICWGDKRKAACKCQLLCPAGQLEDQPRRRGTFSPPLWDEQQCLGELAAGTSSHPAPLLAAMQRELLQPDLQRRPHPAGKAGECSSASCCPLGFKTCFSSLKILSLKIHLSRLMPSGKEAPDRLGEGRRVAWDRPSDKEPNKLSAQDFSQACSGSPAHAWRAGLQHSRRNGGAVKPTVPMGNGGRGCPQSQAEQGEENPLHGGSLWGLQGTLPGGCCCSGPPVCSSAKRCLFVGLAFQQIGAVGAQGLRENLEVLTGNWFPACRAW